MGFIVNNYVWFMIGGGVIFMALIGFIAEKTNFGRGKQVVEVKEQPNFNANEKLLDTVNNNAGIANPELPPEVGFTQPEVQQPISEPVVNPMESIAPQPTSEVVPEIAPINNINMADQNVSPIETTNLEPLTEVLQPTNVLEPITPEEQILPQPTIPVDEIKPLSDSSTDFTIDSVPESNAQVIEPATEINNATENQFESIQEPEANQIIESDEIPTSDEEIMIEAIPKENPVLFTPPLVLDETHSVIDNLVVPNTFDITNNLNQETNFQELPKTDVTNNEVLETPMIENAIPEPTIEEPQEMPENESIEPILEEAVPEKEENLGLNDIAPATNPPIESEDDIWNF